MIPTTTEHSRCIGCRGCPEREWSGWTHAVYSTERIELDLRAFLHQQRLSKSEVDRIVGYGKASNVPPAVADQWSADWQGGPFLPAYLAAGKSPSWIHQQAARDLLPAVPQWTTVRDVNIHEGYIGHRQRLGSTIVEIDEIHFPSQTFFEDKTGSVLGLQANHARRQRRNPQLTLDQVIEEWATRVFTKGIHLQDALSRPGAITSKNAPAREATPLVDDFRSFRNFIIRVTGTDPQVLQAIDTQIGRLQSDPRMAGWTIQRG